MIQAYDIKTSMLQRIKAQGGFVNCHAHIDKAYYITQAGLAKTMLDMEYKWRMSDDIKKASTQADIENRIRTGLASMIKQGVSTIASFVDAYDAVGHKAIDAAINVRKEYQGKINLLTLPQPLGGLIDNQARGLFESIAAKCDIVGGLPSKDRPEDDKNLDITFAIAKNLNKPVHIHIDQENNPNERDTEKLIKATIKHGYEGRVVAIHAISVAAQPKQYRVEIYKKLAAAGIAVIVCPTEAINMRQLDDYTGPIHNSIANVPEMLEAGIVVGLGTDNILDYYGPFNEGDMWFELRLLMEACRYYDFDQLVNIASINGQKICQMK